MKTIKIGYLPLYIKLYDDSDPHYRDPMVAHMQLLVSMLEQQGLEVVRADVCRIKPEFEAAAKLFNDADVDAVVTQHLAYSPSLESIDALLSIQAPLIVFDTTPDYELIARAADYNGIDQNHGIHGVQDMCNLLKQHGRSYELCVGHALHSDVVLEVAGCCRAAAAKKAFQNARVGTVGGSFDGMGDFFVSPEYYRESIGAEVFSMDAETANRYVSAVTDEQVEQEIAWDKAHFTDEISDRENYRKSIVSGLAVRAWAEDNRLTACTINFLSLDRCGLPKMPFAEASKMLQRGMGYAGEGDVLTAGLVGALHSVYQDTTFVEVFCPDWKEDVLLMSHMGECNLDLAQWKPTLRNVPFNYNSCGDTAAAYLCMRPGKAILVNLAPMAGKYSMILSPVEMLNAGLEYGAYRNEIQGWCKPAKPLRTFLKEYSLAGGTHHSAMVYNVELAEMETFARMMGFDVVIL